MQDTYIADPSSDSANVIVLHWPGLNGFGKYSQTSRDYFQLVQEHINSADI